MQRILFSEASPAHTAALPGGGAAQLSWARRGQGAELTIALPYAGAFGMGEKYNALNQKGRTAVNRVEEQFCFQGGHTYCPAPFFWTDSGFGLCVASDRESAFSFGKAITVTLPAGAEVVLFTGTPETMIREYQSLFGSVQLPPRWAFGPWISANRWNSQAQVEQLLEKLGSCGFPATVLVLEAWSDEATFYLWNGAKYTPMPGGQPLRYEDLDFTGSPWPDPRGMVEKLHAAGLHLVLWQVPVYKQQGPEETPNPQNELDRADAVRRGLCVRQAGGAPYTIPSGHWFAGSMLPDFTCPQAVSTWFAKRQYLLDMGVDGFKTDGGEFICGPGARFRDGSSGLEGVNRYARDYTRAYSRFLGPDRVLFSRAGWAGQHTVPIHWAGDQQSQNSELKSALTAGLSAALTGIPFWGFDIGGFAGPLPTLDLYRRATQLACFCPIMQWHSEPDGGQFRELMPGAQGNNERSPWNLAQANGAPEFVAEMRFWHLLRMQLLPYLWATAQASAQTGRPMMRPLVYDWPQDPRAVACGDEYLLGDALLVAPLLEENAETRPVYLPAGRWTGLFDGRACQGGREVLAGGGGKLPVFLREGFESPLSPGAYRA